MKHRAQLQTLHWAISHTQDFSVAVDGGANVGDWSVVMAEHFHEVLAFEPAPDVFKSLVSRMPANVRCYQAALWHRSALVGMCDVKKKAHRSRYVREGGRIPAVALDTSRLPRCGLLKLDLEGGENLALRGAERTLREHHPVVVIEVDNYGRRYGFDRNDSTRFLTSLGYRLAFANGPDAVFLYEGSLCESE